EVWSETLPVFIRDQYVRPQHADLLKIVGSPEEAVAFLKAKIDLTAEETKPATASPIFLKLGGSLLTDKTAFEQVREDVLQRVVQEIAKARQFNPDLRLVLGHGSGSFGHAHASQHGTRQGVNSDAGWAGFAAVSDSALRLNRKVVKALMNAGIPAVSISPSASAVVKDGTVQYMATEPISTALDAGLVPVIHGDVAFDQVRGGTILSTEEVMGYLVGRLKPSSILLAGETEGVYDAAGEVIPRITPDNFEKIKGALGGSRGADVTGGMAAKVQDVLNLAVAKPGMQVRIFGGLEPSVIHNLLINPKQHIGTVVEAV
ncbi:MAG: isopentenyl phosphate kinase, partial [Chloroflexota bacterium]